jgi:hypothetical protein
MIYPITTEPQRFGFVLRILYTKAGSVPSGSLARGAPFAIPTGIEIAQSTDLSANENSDYSPLRQSRVQIAELLIDAIRLVAANPVELIRNNDLSRLASGHPRQ